MEDNLYKERLEGIYSTDSLNNYSESISLLVEPPPELPEPTELPIWTQVRNKYRTTDKFIKSKAAILVLAWSLILGVLFWGDHLYTSIYIVHQNLSYKYFPFIYILNGLPLCLYPLAGMLADNKYGRYRIIMGSLYFSLAIATICSIATCSITLAMLPQLHKNAIRYSLIASAIFFLLSSPGTIGFFANHLPFGLDQLYEAPGDHQSLFIHWLIWFIFLGILINSVSWSLYIILPTYHIGITTRVAIPILATCCLAFTLFIARRNWRWFLADSAKISPYKLVYQVTKFAREHKVPLQRSAFTYCEENLPTGLDLGKAKYGGPFSTEQVEDVKVFYGILKILFCVGPFFFTDIAANSSLYTFARHAIWKNETAVRVNASLANYFQEYLILDGLMTPLLIVLFLPPYICFLRPLIIHNRLGMMKRIGLAMTLQLVSIALTLAMDTYFHHTYFHHKTDNTDSMNCTCMFQVSSQMPQKMDSEHRAFLDLKILIIQRVLVAFSYIFFQIAIFEFICSQSPRSMIGMLFGLAFATRGVNYVIGSLITLPFYVLSTYLSCYCGLVYYLINIAVGLTALIIFMYVARNYQNRTRDEFCDYHRYAENYFSRRPRKATLKKT